MFSEWDTTIAGSLFGIIFGIITTQFCLEKYGFKKTILIMLMFYGLFKL